MFDPQNQLRTFIDASKYLIAPDGLDSVEHYFDVSEFEMAFEGLILELINSSKYPDGFNYSEWMRLAKHYGLDLDPVFDARFWDKFEAWGQSYVSSSRIDEQSS